MARACFSHDGSAIHYHDHSLTVVVYLAGPPPDYSPQRSSSYIEAASRLTKTMMAPIDGCYGIEANPESGTLYLVCVLDLGATTITSLCETLRLVEAEARRWAQPLAEWTCANQVSGDVSLKSSLELQP